MDLEISSIPDHGWNLSSAVTLLAPFCKVDEIAPETRDGTDMSVFRVSAWTPNPDAIRSSDLYLPENDAMIASANLDVAERFVLEVLRYPVTIHVTRSTDFCLPAPAPLPRLLRMTPTPSTSLRRRLSLPPTLIHPLPSALASPPPPRLSPHFPGLVAVLQGRLNHDHVMP